MRSLRDTPFPFETVRDLLGVLRAMYVATQRSGNERRLKAIAEVGRELQRASTMARKHDAGSLGFSAAWERAEKAVVRLGELVDCTTPLEPTLRAAGERIRKESRVGGDARERKRLSLRSRS